MNVNRRTVYSVVIVKPGYYWRGIFGTLPNIDKICQALSHSKFENNEHEIAKMFQEDLYDTTLGSAQKYLKVGSETKFHSGITVTVALEKFFDWG